MPPSTTTPRDQLHDLTVSTTPLFHQVDRCSIGRNHEELATLLLLPAGLFSLFSLRVADQADPAVWLTMGRIVATHAADAPDLPGGASVTSQVLDLEREQPDRPPPPASGVTLTLSRATARIAQYSLRTGDAAAIFLLTEGTVMPVAWMMLSAPVLPDEILAAIGEILARHYRPVSAAA